MTRSHKLKVHNANLQKINSYYIFHRYSLFFFSVFAFCLCVFFQTKNIYSDTHSTIEVSK